MWYSRSRIPAPAFRPKPRTRCSTGSRAIPTARGIAARASGCRWCAPLSNCTAARCASIPIVAKGTTVICEFPLDQIRPASRRGMTAPTDILARASERDRDRPSDGRSCAADRPRRRHHAVGRSRRRQDGGRPRHDPLSRRRRRAGGAEPDLHAGADLRPAVVPAGPCRPLPHQRCAPSWRKSASRRCPRAPSR